MPADTPQIVLRSSRELQVLAVKWCRDREQPVQGLYSSSVSCSIRARLETIYLRYVAEIDIAGIAIRDKKSEAWRRATQEARENCAGALTGLNRASRGARLLKASFVFV
jgi:hypothetical protein